MVRHKDAPLSRWTREKQIKEIQKTEMKIKRVKQFRVLQEIKYLTKTVDLLIPKAAFQRIVKEICIEVAPVGLFFKITAGALEALQEACEMYLVQLFEDCVTASIHAKRLTVKLEDMRLVRRLRGKSDVANH